MPTQNSTTTVTDGPPNRHKLSLLLWIGIYPTITGVLSVLLPILQPRYPLPIITLIVTVIVVPLMNYAVMPFLLWRFGSWVRK